MLVRLKSALFRQERNWSVSAGKMDLAFIQNLSRGTCQVDWQEVADLDEFTELGTIGVLQEHDPVWNRGMNLVV